MNKLTLAAAVLAIIDTQRNSGQDINAFEVTQKLRSEVNASEVELTDVQFEHLPCGRFSQNVSYSKVRDNIRDLYANGTLGTTYTRDYAQGPNGSFTIYRYVAPVSTVATIPVSTAPAPQAALSVASQGSTVVVPDVSSKVRVYIDNKFATGQTPTLKQVQSRLKGVHITCAQLGKVVKDLGFTVVTNPHYSYSTVTK